MNLVIFAHVCSIGNKNCINPPTKIQGPPSTEVIMLWLNIHMSFFVFENSSRLAVLCFCRETRIKLLFNNNIRISFWKKRQQSKLSSKYLKISKITQGKQRFPASVAVPMTWEVFNFCENCAKICDWRNFKTSVHSPYLPSLSFHQQCKEDLSFYSPFSSTECDRDVVGWCVLFVRVVHELCRVVFLSASGHYLGVKFPCSSVAYFLFSEFFLSYTVLPCWHWFRPNPHRRDDFAEDNSALPLATVN